MGQLITQFLNKPGDISKIRISNCCVQEQMWVREGSSAHVRRWIQRFYCSASKKTAVISHHLLIWWREGPAGASRVWAAPPHPRHVLLNPWDVCRASGFVTDRVNGRLEEKRFSHGGNLYHPPPAECSFRVTAEPSVRAQQKDVSCSAFLWVSWHELGSPTHRNEQKKMCRKARLMGRIGWQGLCSGVREKDLSSSSLENIWAQQKTWNATQQRGAPLFPSPGNVSSCRVRLEPAVSSNPISLPAMGVPMLGMQDRTRKSCSLPSVTGISGFSAVPCQCILGPWGSSKKQSTPPICEQVQVCLIAFLSTLPNCSSSQAC